jgi:uncharacterized damage-inducible protein DinB
METGLADFFKQNLWANLRLLDVCSKLSDEQLDASMNGTFGSVRETLIHLFAAEERYVSRLTGQRFEPALSERDPFPGFDELRQRARQTGEELVAIIQQEATNQILHIVYDGESHEVPALFVLIQAINHATDHRSQVATLLTQQEITPPELDGWSYYAAIYERQGA